MNLGTKKSLASHSFNCDCSKNVTFLKCLSRAQMDAANQPSPQAATRGLRRPAERRETAVSSWGIN